MQDFICLAFFLLWNLLASQLIMSHVTNGTCMGHRQQNANNSSRLQPISRRHDRAHILIRTNPFCMAVKATELVTWDIYSWGRLHSAVGEVCTKSLELWHPMLAQHIICVLLGAGTGAWCRVCSCDRHSYSSWGSWAEWSIEKFLIKHSYK